MDEDVIHIQKNPRHFEKLFEVVGVSNSMHPKKVPCHELMNEFDDAPALGPEKSSRFRSALVCCSIWQVTWWNVHTQYEVWLNT